MTASFDCLEHVTAARDLAVLAELAAQVGGPGTIGLEVGSWVGGSALVLARHLERVFCVDHFGGTESDSIGEVGRRHGQKKVLDTFCENMGPRLGRDVVPLVGHSLDWAARLRGKLAFDLVFVDADHDYGPVAADILAWGPLVCPGALLCGHDYGTFPGVTRAVQELVPGFQVKGTVWFAKMGPRE